MSSKVHIKVIKVRKNNGSVVVEEVESGEERTLNLSNKLAAAENYPEEGQEYWSFINENFLNWFGEFKPEEKKEKPKPTSDVLTDEEIAEIEKDVLEDEKAKEKESFKEATPKTQPNTRSPSYRRSLSIVDQSLGKVAAELTKIVYEAKDVKEKTVENVLKDYKAIKKDLVKEMVEEDLIIE